jgi:urease accessory protein
MLQVCKLIPQGQGLATVIINRAPFLALDWDLRQKSRFDATTSEGRTVGVFLTRGAVIRGGDVLITTAGSFIRVLAAPQPVLRITACTAHGHGHAHDHGAFDLMRAAYHLGNRHVPIELKPDHLKIEPDHVLADMLRAMHLAVAQVSAAFEPESGAYGQANSHGHAHSQGDHHQHSHG